MFSHSQLPSNMSFLKYLSTYHLMAQKGKDFFSTQNMKLPGQCSAKSYLKFWNKYAIIIPILNVPIHSFYDIAENCKYIQHRKACFIHSLGLPKVAQWSIFRILVWWQFLRLYCSDMTFKHTNSLHRCRGLREKWKRPTKVMKAKQRPESQQDLNFIIFSYQLDHLVYFIDRFECFWVSRPLRPKRPH